MAVEQAHHDETVNRILFLTVQKTEAHTGKNLADPLLNPDILPIFNISILFDKEIDLKNHSLMLWKFFNNVIPDRDIRIQNRRLVKEACRKGTADGHEREWLDKLRFDL